MRFLRRALAGAAVLVVAATTATVSQAAPTDHGTYDVQESYVTSSCGLPTSIEVHRTGVVNGRVTGRDGTLRYTVTAHGESTWTNVATGKAFTFVWNTTNQDLRATDNGDGTLDINFQTTGPEKIYGPDGSRVFLWVGRSTWLVVLDFGGTLDDPSDDTFVSQSFLGFDGKPDPTGGSDFCEQYTTLTA